MLKVGLLPPPSFFLPLTFHPLDHSRRGGEEAGRGRRIKDTVEERKNKVLFKIFKYRQGGRRRREGDKGRCYTKNTYIYSLYLEGRKGKGKRRKRRRRRGKRVVEKLNSSFSICRGEAEEEWRERVKNVHQFINFSCEERGIEGGRKGGRVRKGVREGGRESEGRRKAGGREGREGKERNILVHSSLSLYYVRIKSMTRKKIKIYIERKNT